MPKLTKSFLNSLKPDPIKDFLFVWDTELRGFAVRMKPSGRASYIVQYKTRQGHTRRYAFAKTEITPPDQARQQAKLLLAEVQAGGDPSKDRHEARTAVTVQALCRHSTSKPPKPVW
jgi:hypothetical protein